MGSVECGGVEDVMVDGGGRWRWSGDFDDGKNEK